MSSAAPVDSDQPGSSDRDRLLDFAQSDRRLRRVAQRVILQRSVQFDAFASPADPTPPRVQVVRRRQPIGEVFRVLQYCSGILTPFQPPRALSVGKISLSILLSKRVVRAALRTLTARGYLQLHSRSARGVGLYTITVVRNGALVVPHELVPPVASVRHGE